MPRYTVTATETPADETGYNGDRYTPYDFYLTGLTGPDSHAGAFESKLW